jgi:hypothetical protein
MWHRSIGALLGPRVSYSGFTLGVIERVENSGHLVLRDRSKELHPALKLRALFTAR